MPARSRAQQRLFGMVHALQKGELDPSDVSEEVRRLARELDAESVAHFAGTAHRGLPGHVEKRAMPGLLNIKFATWTVVTIEKDGKSFKFKSMEAAAKYFASIAPYSEDDFAGLLHDRAGEICGFRVFYG